MVKKRILKQKKFQSIYFQKKYEKKGNKSKENFEKCPYLQSPKMSTLQKKIENDKKLILKQKKPKRKYFRKKNVKINENKSTENFEK